MNSLQAQIERWYGAGPLSGQDAAHAREAFHELREALTRGLVRAAEKRDGQWHVNAWVKQGILLGFRLGELEDMSGQSALSFVDKSTFPVRRFNIEDKVRVVPGGSSVRTGAYMAPGVICMPPMYVNAGAYVDEGTLIDSHALVGSCAQIG
jgi:2,3,4,5-tetrahydropyridine-2-carboxylate N-succinyltransferase